MSSRSSLSLILFGDRNRMLLISQYSPSCSQVPLSIADVAFCVEHSSGGALINVQNASPCRRVASRRARHELATRKCVAWAPGKALLRSAARVESARRSARGTQGKAAAIGAATEASPSFSPSRLSDSCINSRIDHSSSPSRRDPTTRESRCRAFSLPLLSSRPFSR